VLDARKRALSRHATWAETPRLASETPRPASETNKASSAIICLSAAFEFEFQNLAERFFAKRLELVLHLVRICW
jgi:hypothetical protein